LKIRKLGEEKLRNGMVFLFNDGLLITEVRKRSRMHKMRVIAYVFAQTFEGKENFDFL